MIAQADMKNADERPLKALRCDEEGASRFLARHSLVAVFWQACGESSCFVLWLTENNLRWACTRDVSL